MIHPKRTSRAASFVLGAITCVCLACGGGASQATFDPATISQLTEDEQAAYSAIVKDNQEWFAWKRGIGRYVAQDFVNCFEVNGLPTPLVQPEVQDDGVGHSRPRQYCTKAVDAIRAALPTLQAFADQALAITIPEKSAYRHVVATVEDARKQRLAWAQEVLQVWPTTDTARLQQLVARDKEIYSLELKALIVNSGVTSP